MNPETTAMVGLVFVLGLKHGFDPDHLVAIDGMARSSKSRWCGVFFSLGHGAAVTLIGVAVALAAAQWQAPSWLEHTGAWISIGVLLALGSANLAMLRRTPAGARVRLVGLRASWFAERLARASHPMVIAAVGAAFALSFDTVSHVLTFSLTGAATAGWLFAGALGLLFTLGMVLTDGANGLWVAKVLARADRRAAAASRWMSGAIAFLCFALALFGMTKYASPALADFAPLVSLATLVLIAGAAVLASRSAYREANS